MLLFSAKEQKFNNKNFFFLSKNENSKITGDRRKQMKNE